MKELRELVQVKNETWAAIEAGIKRLNIPDERYFQATTTRGWHGWVEGPYGVEYVDGDGRILWHD